MKTLFCLAAAATLFAAGAASAADSPPLAMTKAVDCVKAHVEEVVALDHDLNSASEFLLNYACSEETAAASRYEFNKRLVTILQPILMIASKKSPDQTPQLMVDELTGDLTAKGGEGDAKIAMAKQMLAAVAGFNTGKSGQAPIGLRIETGRIVLAAVAKRR